MDQIDRVEIDQIGHGQLESLQIAIESGDHNFFVHSEQQMPSIRILLFFRIFGRERFNFFDRAQLRISLNRLPHKIENLGRFDSVRIIIEKRNEVKVPISAADQQTIQFLF